MRYVIDHDFHIHSGLSVCSGDPEQNPARILRYGEENNYRYLCLTDHYWDEKVPFADYAPERNWALDFYRRQDTAHIRQALPLPQGERTRFFFGCEAEMDLHGTLGISPETAEQLDMIVVATSHMHMTNFTIPRHSQLAEYAARFLSRIDRLMDLDLPFHKVGIAHLAGSLGAPENQLLLMFRLIPDAELHRVFARVARAGAGIELNAGDFQTPNCENPETRAMLLRLFGIAKEEGCRFYLGSDAHHPSWLGACVRSFENAVELLGLTEDDKFCPFDR